MSIREELLSSSQADRDGLRTRFDPWLWSRGTAKVYLPKTPDGPGGLIDLRLHPFMAAVYRDLHPEIVVLKGAQLGFSTTAILRSFWFLTTTPCSVIYTFPTTTDVGNYTAARINPLVQGSVYLRRRILDVNSVQLKQFALAPDEELDRRAALPRVVRYDGLPRSTIYFRGSSSEKDAISVDADLLVHDEEDLANPQIIEQFESRLDASRFKWRFRLSTPRIPGSGIDRVFRETDMRRWFVTCPSCNAEFEMGFPGGPFDHSNIEPDPTGWSEEDWDRWEKDGSNARYVCHRCGKELSNDARLAGRWQITAPGPAGRAHGYSLSQMAAAWVSATRILERRRKATWESDFWNLVMGVPWEEGTNAFTEDAIKGRMDVVRPMALTSQGSFMGVDVGAKMDVIVDEIDPSGRPRTIQMARLDTYAELDDFMRRYNVVVCAIDAAPEEHMTREWAAKYNVYPTKVTPNGRIRVWRVTYGGGNRPGKGPELEWKPELGLVSAPRTEILSKSGRELLEDRILPRFDGSVEWLAYIAHHVNSKKVAVFVEGLEKQRIVDRYEWHEVGPDHLFHAATYAMIARMAPRVTGVAIRGLISLQRSKAQRPMESRFER